MRKGFTLIELLIVIIIIGVLAAIAVPQYLNSVERGKLAKAKSNLGLLLQAEKMARSDNDTYVALTANNANNTLGGYVELAGVDNDKDWTYATTSASTAAIVVQATRVGGSYGTAKISYDQDGVCTADSSINTTSNLNACGKN